MKKIVFFLLLMILVGCGKEDDFGNENFNDHIVGPWYIGDGPERIEFYEEDYFILGDTLFGNYWVNEDNPKEIKYICDDEEDVSTMKFIRYIGSYRSIIVENLPKHPGETHIVKIEE